MEGSEADEEQGWRQTEAEAEAAAAVKRKGGRNEQQ